MADRRISETDLAKRVIQWLVDQHWDVYQEIKFRGQGGLADIVAVRDGMLWIIESKTSLTLSVFEQAVRWRAHFRSVAVPVTRSGQGRRIAREIAKNYLRVGVIEVGKEVHSIPPPMMREYHKQAKYKIAQLRPEHKTCCEAGSNRGGRYTPYRMMMDHVKRFVAGNPGCTLKEIVTEVKSYHHYASDKSAISCIRTALARWETDWCRVEVSGKEFRYYVREVNRCQERILTSP
jgi:hypothetical protein